MMVNKIALTVVKFTPASGAASRMFKLLHEFLSDYDPQKESINSYINKNKIGRVVFVFCHDRKITISRRCQWIKCEIAMPDYDSTYFGSKTASCL